MIDKAFKQFKMSNDDEVICEVLEWNNEENDALIVRSALKLVNVEDFEKGIRFYAFRPWMVYIDDPDVLHTVNSHHIISEVDPSDEIIKQYVQAVAKLRSDIKEKKKKPSASLDEMTKLMADMDEDEFDHYLDQIASESREVDSAEVGNVIKFKPKDTLH
jgi:hypothetical protein